MRKYNKTCIVCGEKYTFCTSCSEFDKYPRWMGIYHDENCKNIFTIASDYIEKVITKEEAKEKFDKCDLTNKDKFHKTILNAINEIYAKDDNKKVVNKIVEEKIEDKVNDNVKVEIVPQAENKQTKITNNTNNKKYGNNKNYKNNK